MKTLAHAVIIVLLCAAQAGAGGIPVFDSINNMVATSSMIEDLQHTANQIKQLANQYQQIRNQVAQIRQMDVQHGTITGNYNMGAFLNNPFQKQLRRYLPGNWYELKELLKKAGIPTSLGDAIKKAREARKRGEQYPTGTIFTDTEQVHAVAYAEEGDRLYAAMGASQTAYERTNQNLENIEAMTDQIDQANDLKAAVDLGNRIGAENAMLINELIRQISILNIQQAESREQWRNQAGADLHRADMAIPDITQSSSGD
jgi:type IV secretion system protein VirB5